ncbi:MAG: type II toxin-antitoxin system VapB family antitoxin [Pseudomonadota bacterium]
MKTTVDIDSSIVDALREELGARTKRETIDCALRFLLDRVQNGDAVVSSTFQDGRMVCLPEEKAGAVQRAMEMPQARGDHAARLI